MKKLLTLILFCWGVAHAVDAPKPPHAPDVLKAEDKAEYLYLVNEVQQLQLTLYQLQNQYKSTQDMLQQAYNQALDKNKALQDKYHAEGFHLTDQGTWQADGPGANIGGAPAAPPPKK